MLFNCIGCRAQYHPRNVYDNMTEKYGNSIHTIDGYFIREIGVDPDWDKPMPKAYFCRTCENEYEMRFPFVRENRIHRVLDAKKAHIYSIARDFDFNIHPSNRI